MDLFYNYSTSSKFLSKFKITDHIITDKKTIISQIIVISIQKTFLKINRLIKLLLNEQYLKLKNFTSVHGTYVNLNAPF